MARPPSLWTLHSPLSLKRRNSRRSPHSPSSSTSSAHSNRSVSKTFKEVQDHDAAALSNVKVNFSPTSSIDGRNKLRKASPSTPTASPAAQIPPSNSIDQDLLASGASPQRETSTILSESHGAEALTVDTSMMSSPSSSSHENQGASDIPNIWRGGTVHESPDAMQKGHPTIDVPLRLDRKMRRPKMHVSIPAPRLSHSIAYNPHRLQAGNGDAVMRGSRSASPHSQARFNWNGFAHSRTPSPGAFSSPSERSTRTSARTGTGLYLDGLGLERQMASTGPSSSSTSLSSQETIDEDSLSYFSGGTSISSVTADSHGKSNPRTSPSGSIASLSASPTGGKGSGLKTTTTRSSRPVKSKLSPAELYNKPLPLAPVDIAPAPLSLPSRPSPLAAARKTPSPQPPRSQSVRTGSVESVRSPMTPKSAPALRSKYWSRDLDSIDLAFQRSSPKIESMALKEAEQALQAHLSTINEDDPFSWDELPGVSGPLQISRGPMEMKPSRAAPAPPKIHHMEPSRLRKKNHLSVASNTALAVKSPLRERAPSRGSFFDGERKRTSQMLGFRGRAFGSLSALRYLRPGLSRSQSASPTGSNVDLPITSASTELDSKDTTDDERFSHFFEDNLYEMYSDRSVYMNSPYASSSALPLSPKSIEPKSSDFGLPIQQPPAELPGSEPPRRESLSCAPQVKIIPRTEDDVNGKKTAQRRGRRQSSVVMSLVSLAASDVPDWYLNMPSSTEYATRRKMADTYGAGRNINAEAAETVILKILQSLDNLQDLFSTAVVSRGFYRTFKRNELPLMKNALKSMSAPAWELREASLPFADGSDLDRDRPMPKYTPSTYLRHYIRDMYIIVALKSLILARCKSTLRPETVSALAGNDDQRSLQLDDAFWRVWTFCQMFGSNTGREDDRAGQLEWLRGGEGTRLAESITITRASTAGNSVLQNPPETFGKSNHSGLSPAELWDMLEIWTCLGLLVQGFRGKADMAREAGVFDELEVDEADAVKEGVLLDEWILYIATLGPSIILDLATPSDQPGSQGFVVAAENGWTKWSPLNEGASRTTFLKDVVTQLYQDKMSLQPRSPSPSFTIPPSPTSVSAMIHMGADSSVNAATNDSKSVETTPIISSTEGDFTQPQSTEPPTPITEDSHPQNSPSSPTPVEEAYSVEQAVWDLVGMGFPVEQARRAISQTPEDPSAAFDLCLLWSEETSSQGGRSRSNSGEHQMSSKSARLLGEPDLNTTSPARMIVAR
ncbi:MAG: hypothetical protein M1816_008057 [Peltula sp. TS41687]|nr:MAG: hypothetical protein M1816_008057 [Peltula sp. TS41687]